MEKWDLPNFDINILNFFLSPVAEITTCPIGKIAENDPPHSDKVKIVIQ